MLQAGLLRVVHADMRTSFQLPPVFSISSSTLDRKAFLRRPQQADFHYIK